jgi:hypothetical protein
MTIVMRGLFIGLGLAGVLIGALALLVGAYTGYGVVSDLVRGTGPLGKDPLLSILLLGLGAFLLKGGLQSLRRGRAI